nr:hypothetical protein [Tanacetum cinerariifolium]
VIVVVILVVVIVVIVGVVIVVAIIWVVVDVTIIRVVIVIGVFAIIKLSFVIIEFEVLKPFPSILLGNPSMKTSISLSEFGTIVGHKVANSWNLLITVATRKYQFSSFKPMNETNSSFRTIEVERLTAHKLLLESWLVLQMLMSFWEALYQHLQDNIEDGHGDNGMSDSIGGLVSLVDLTGDEDLIDEDGDTGVGDSEVSVSLGEISSGGKKSQKSNIGDTKIEAK